jgi:hypothetical protein
MNQIRLASLWPPANGRLCKIDHSRIAVLPSFAAEKNTARLREAPGRGKQLFNLIQTAVRQARRFRMAKKALPTADRRSGRMGFVHHA